jgi:hypothetical protein
MTPDLELGPTEWLILDYAYDDWFGLFELRGQLDEEGAARVESRRQEFISGLDRLIAEGLVEIAVRPDPFTIPGPPLSKAEATALVRDNRNWADPQLGEPLVTFVATDQGRTFYEQRGPNPFS